MFSGTTANDQNLLEGIVRWNEDREAAAVQGPSSTLRSYNGQLIHAVNQLSERVLGHSIDDRAPKPGQYTGTFNMIINYVI